MTQYQLFDAVGDFFRHNHMVEGANHAVAIRLFCRDNDCYPWIERNPDESTSPYAVWYGYSPIGSGDCIVHPGWEQYITARGWRALPRVVKFDEADIENKLALRLRSRGVQVESQVYLRSGIADLVTSDAVYEIKLELTRESLFKAIGQVLVYALELGKPNKFIVGQTSETLTIQTAASQLGIRVLSFDPNTELFTERGAANAT